MKKLLYFLLLFAFSSYGQSTNAFDYTTARWCVAKTYPNGNVQNPNFIQTTTLIYGIYGDTIIAGTGWGKVWVTSDPDFALDMTYLGLMRETNGLAIFIDTNNVLDTLYNFNIQLGDSVVYQLAPGGNKMYVTAIDSVLVAGNYLRKIIFSAPDGLNPMGYLKEVWIEGIGSIHGPLFPANPHWFSTETADSTMLTCFSIDDVVLWHNPFYTDCNVNIILGTGNVTQLSDKLVVFPNPAQTTLNLKLPAAAGKVSMVTVLDISGRTVVQSEFSAFGELTLDTSELDRGVYFIRLENSGMLYSTKFVKQ